MVFLRTGLGALAISLSLFAAPLAGCGDSTGTGSGGSSSDGGAGGGGTTATTSSAGGGATTNTATVTTGAGGSNDCNTLTAGAMVAQARDASTAPAAAGGTIIDGTYVLTASIVFTGPGGLTTPTGATPSGAIRFAGTDFEFLSVNTTDVLRANATYVVNGTSLDFTYNCPFNSPVSTPYTATGTTVALYTGMTVDTYTIQ